MLQFWDMSFALTPIMMIAMGVYTFVICVYGFLISDRESRPALILMAILLAVACLAQLTSIGFAMTVHMTINRENIPIEGAYDDMKYYNIPGYEDVTSRWDRLQSDLGCCGAHGWHKGFLDWKRAKFTEPGLSTLDGGRQNVPDSCCLREEAINCGVINDDRMDKEYYKHGCMTKLEIKLKEEVAPIILGYIFVSAALALLEIITVALASAYVAQISRRMKAEDMFSRPADAGKNDYDASAPLTSRGETAF
jgi:hypothetical protein